MADNDSKPRFHREPPCLHIDKLLNLTFNLCNQTGYTFYKAAEFARDYEIENGIEEHHAKIRMFATLYAAAPWHAQGERSEKQIIEISAPVIDTIVSVPQEPLKHEWVTDFGGQWVPSSYFDARHEHDWDAAYVQCVVVRFDLNATGIESEVSGKLIGAYLTLFRNEKRRLGWVNCIFIRDPNTYGTDSVISGVAEIAGGTTEEETRTISHGTVDPELMVTGFRLVSGLLRMMHERTVEIKVIDPLTKMKKKRRKRSERRAKRSDKLVKRKLLTLVTDPPPATMVEVKVLPPPRPQSEQTAGPTWHQRPHWRDEHTAVRWVKKPAGRPVLGFGASSRLTPLYAVRVPVKGHKRGQGEHRDVTTITTITTEDTNHGPQEEAPVPTGHQTRLDWNLHSD